VRHYRWSIGNILREKRRREELGLPIGTVIVARNSPIKTTGTPIDEERRTKAVLRLLRDILLPPVIIDVEISWSNLLSVC